MARHHPSSPTCSHLPYSIALRQIKDRVSGHRPALVQPPSSSRCGRNCWRRRGGTTAAAAASAVACTSEAGAGTEIAECVERRADTVGTVAPLSPPFGGCSRNSMGSLMATGARVCMCVCVLLLTLMPRRVVVVAGHKIRVRLLFQRTKGRAGPVTQTGRYVAGHTRSHTRSADANTFRFQLPHSD